jgi:beta-lactamase superfamily II metal-dependent hydrolase
VSQLGVHVLGEGFGESIVLSFPNGSAGVVDCFARKLPARDHAERMRVNPTLRFLRNDLKADRLAFVALTHPHEDHGRGLSHLLRDYEGAIDEIWLFPGFETIDLGKYFAAVVKTQGALAVEEMLGDAPGTFAEELMTVRELCAKAIAKGNPKRARFRYFRGPRRAHVKGEPDVSLSFIGPPDGLAEAYIGQMTNGVKELLRADGTVDPAWDPRDVNHNWISPCLLIEYGETRVLLGGDMEEPAWASVEKELDDGEANLDGLGCHLMKVSHHGSSTGYTKTLYERLKFQGRKPVAVLTCFNRNKHPLPSEEGVAHLLQATSELLSTNAAFAAVASLAQAVSPTGIATHQTAPSAVPQKWLRALRRKPELAGLLRPSLLRTEINAPEIGAVPRAWVADIQKRPELAFLLRQELRSRTGLPPGTEPDVVQLHRISIFYDNNGNEVKRSVGERAGEFIGG